MRQSHGPFAYPPRQQAHTRQWTGWLLICAAAALGMLFAAKAIPQAAQDAVNTHNLYQEGW